jgi:hypothetical protein
MQSVKIDHLQNHSVPTMPRQMSPEREKEYQKVYSNFDFYIPNVNGVAPDSQLGLASTSK